MKEASRLGMKPVLMLAQTAICALRVSPSDGDCSPR